MRLLLDSCCDGNEGGGGDFNSGHTIDCPNFLSAIAKLHTFQHLLKSFSFIDNIYNDSFNPKTGRHDKTKRECCAEFLNLPVDNEIVDIYYLCHEYRGGQKDAIKYRVGMEERIKEVNKEQDELEEKLFKNKVKNVLS